MPIEIDVSYLPAARDRWMKALGAMICSLSLCGLAFAQTTATVTVSSQTLGHTPGLIGYNLGHWLPGSNTADWWQHSGVNAARIFLNPSSIEPAGDDDLPPYGDGVTDLASFNARRSALRADPLNPNYINWSYFESRLASVQFSGNVFYAQSMLASLTSLGSAPLAVITRGTSYGWGDPSTAAGWQDRWEAWQQAYAFAFYLARYFNVQRFQMYNEPDLSIDPQSFLQRLQFASDAMQAAVLDVNRIFGKSLSPRINAPVTAGGSSAYASWGRPAILGLHIDYSGAVVPSFDLLHTYDYHRYNLTAAQQASQLATLRSNVNADAPGEGILMAESEFNVHTAAVYDTLTSTLDTPSDSALLGAILVGLINGQADELYIFKFSQTGDSTYVNSGVKKNGCHYVANDANPLNIGGATKGAEVIRLSTAFEGGQTLLNIPAISGAGAASLTVAAARSNDQTFYYLLSVNQANSTITTTFNLSNWNLPTGTPITVEEVDARWHGGVTAIISLPSTKTLTLPHPASSVLRLTVPATPPQQVTLTATDDATVRPGSNATVNFGSSPDLLVKSSQSTVANRAAALIRFDLASVSPATVRRAALCVTGQNPGGSAIVIAHVYGIDFDNWIESNVNWSIVPNLSAALGFSGTGDIQTIKDNFILGAGSTAHILGHLTADATPTQLMVDVTPFITANTNRYASFLIAREVRFDPPPGGTTYDVDDVNYLRIASRQDTSSLPPRLLLQLSGPPTFIIDTDADGDVDMIDFAAFQRCINGDGFPMIVGCERFDLDGNGQVGSADVAAFIGCLSGSDAAIDWNCLP